MSKGRPFRWGVLGAGVVARHFGYSLKLLPDHRLHAVASRSIRRAEQTRSDLGAERAYDDYRALIDDDSIDAIYIASPAAFHRQHAEMALTARKPVLCEKPFAVNAAEADAIVDAARRANVFCMEAMWMRFIPAVIGAKKCLSDGMIGDLHLLQADLGFCIPYANNNPHFDPTLGGGALLDLGVYPLSLAWYLLGRPREGRALSTLAPTGVDSQMIVCLSFASGALASLTCSFNQRLRNMAFVCGSEGSLEFDAPLFAPGEFVVTRSLSPSEDADGSSSRLGHISRVLESLPKIVELRRRYASILRRLFRRERSTSTFSFPGYGYQFEAAEVARCVREGRLESDVMPLVESVEILQAADALREVGTFDWRDLT